MEERVTGVGYQGRGWEIVFLDFDHFIDGSLAGVCEDCLISVE